MRLAVIAVEGFEIEPKLAQVLRFEAVHLQLDGHQAVEPSMKKQQIECEVPPANLHGVFRSDETEVAPEFDEKVPEPHQQSAMQVVFCVGNRQVEKLDKICVLEDAAGRGTVNLSHHW